MKRKSPAGALISGFLKSFCVILLLVITFFISYKISYYVQEKKGGSYDKVTDKIVHKIADQDQERPELLRNVIYGVEKQSGQIRAAVIEELDTTQDTLVFRTISVTQQLRLSNEFYKKMFTVNEDVPQILPLEDMMKYFQGNAIYEYANNVLDDYTGAKMSCYTTLPMEEFENIFEFRDGCFRFTDSMEETCRGMKDSESVREYLYEFYSFASSNFSRSMKCQYIEDYRRLDETQIRFTGKDAAS